MGGKQSKRSVDISGEAAGAGSGAGAGEVAAAGAGGEGRVEPLADADALKPQLNGDTPHIQPPEEISEKEKQLENGTAENEKDATTEKETATNGAGADEQENGDAKPAADADNNKKNKKEKVKKKWSLRSISFSRKDKPKQEKKQKDEEPKTNGETDQLPEEGIDASALAESKSSEDVKVVITTEENKDEKTPETPVTEPITNGSSAPETPKEEEAPAKKDSPVPSPTVEKPVELVRVPEEPEKLPMNGLSLEDVKEEVPEVKTIEPAESKVEQPAVPVPEEPASTPDIPVATEVCVGQSPLSEPAPPPLPHNPPPSSVTAFAETTMALPSVDASVPPVSAALPIAATLEIVPSVEGSPIDSKLDSQLLNGNVPPTITSTPLNDPSVNVNINMKSDNSAEISALITNTEPLETAEEVNRPKTPELNGTPVPEILLEEKSLDTIEQPAVSIEPIVEVSNESKDLFVPLNQIQSAPLSEELEFVVERIVQVQDVVEVPEGAESVTQNGDHKENGSDENKELPACLNGESESVIEITKTIIDTVEINTKDSSLLENALIIEPIVKAEHQTNGSTLEVELAALQITKKEQAVISNETIPPVAKPESLPIVEEVPTGKIYEAESPISPLSEAPPPPSHEDAIGSGEENRGSNEEVSGSFPLPPSELCPSESEASGPATPEPPQEEASPLIEKPADISITETLAEKTQLADIVEARSSPAPEAAAAVTTAGAGDGAPSD